RPAQPEAGELLGNSRSAIIARNADPQRLRCPATGRLKDFIIDRQQPARLIDDELAAWREAHARYTLVEQFITEHRLQALDLGADRRLGDPEGLGRLGKTTKLDDGDQGP